MIKWNSEANEALNRVPFFVRKRVRKRVEEEAVRCGCREVTIRHVETCRKKFLNLMEDEVKGFQVETCFGLDGCPNRAVDSDGLPEKIKEVLSKRHMKSFLKERVNGALKMHHEFRISISDCPNACSRPQIVDIGLIGALRPEVTDEPCTQCGACVEACRESAVSIKENTPVVDYSRCLCCGQCVRVCPTGSIKEAQQGYRVMVGGKLGRHPRLATQLGGIHTPSEALEVMEGCLDHYQSHCVKGERFGEILEREPLPTSRASIDC